MSTSPDTENRSFIQRWVLLIVGLFFVVSLVAYLSEFHDGLSSDQGTWGEFGDFMGGAINPIVGLCTVWLLTVSLQQNQTALRQSHAELMLATKALEESSAMQSKTESALQEQIRIADQARDMANAAALANFFHGKEEKLHGMISSRREIKSTAELNARISERGKAAKVANQLEQILEIEASRLVTRYDKKNSS